MFDEDEHFEAVHALHLHVDGTDGPIHSTVSAAGEPVDHAMVIAEHAADIVAELLGLDTVGIGDAGEGWVVPAADAHVSMRHVPARAVATYTVESLDFAEIADYLASQRGWR